MSQESNPESWVTSGTWEFVIVPEEFCIYGLKGVVDFFEDLYEIGADDHVQYPTAVFYSEEDDGA